MDRRCGDEDSICINASHIDDQRRLCAAPLHLGLASLFGCRPVDAVPADSGGRLSESAGRGYGVALEQISGTGARVAGGSPSASDVERAREAGIKTIRLDAGSFDRAGADMSWVGDIPTVRTVFLHGKVKTPDLTSMSSSTIEELCVWTPAASPVSSEELGWLSRIDCEAESFVVDGWVGLASVVRLQIGRVVSETIRIGDGCERLEFLKLQGKARSAAIDWTSPPSRLAMFITHGIRWKNLDGLAGAAAIASVQVYNSSVDAGQGEIDISAFANARNLTVLDIAENLPIRGVPAVLAGAPSAKVYVARGHHDSTATSDRIHEVKLPIKKTSKRV